MKIKTPELLGHALDWAVAKCEDKEVMRCGAGPSAYLAYIPKRSAYKIWRPSTNWVQGGPIIEREIDKYLRVLTADNKSWVFIAYTYEMQMGAGPTPLIAAMRCFVASKLGDEIDVPEELCQSHHSI